MEDIEKLIAKRQEENAKKKQQEQIAHKNEGKEISIQPQEEPKALGNIGLNDIKVQIDKNQSYEEQAETVVGAMSVASAIQSEETQKKLVDAKSEELKVKAETKVKKAKAEAIEAETTAQEAERKLYESVLETFGIYKHLPKWLMKIVVVLLVPIYILFIFFIHVPMGAVKCFIDGLDGVFVRYEAVSENTKPRLKVATWVLLGLVIIGVICLTTLKIFKII